ncbi:hypothetical protein G3O08_15840 [Cryomorpha ignava]|uniref:Uncharacterized protein n=1 Tax=Cryomorpha ignava TaxID=101383 RepID=A0A7K3WVM0_9FLAO|nr:hypothetical protein [Cryomorpha ignava]NEN24972.1 hypothetical protein [Cryomorpha ignava]
MKFIEDIRRFFGEKLLKAKLETPRKPAVHNFSDARSVAIIYKEKGESFYILVKQYVKYLRDEHGIRDIMAMAYIEDKKVVPHYHVHKLKFDYFSRSELNWRLEPTCDQVENFVGTEFDILIDFEKEPCLPLRFLLAESKAAFKVGYYDPQNEPFYDMMLASGNSDTFDEYIKQINHYLTLINRQDARA